MTTWAELPNLVVHKIMDNLDEKTRHGFFQDFGPKTTSRCLLHATNSSLVGRSLYCSKQNGHILNWRMASTHEARVNFFVSMNRKLSRSPCYMLFKFLSVRTSYDMYVTRLVQIPLAFFVYKRRSSVTKLPIRRLPLQIRVTFSRVPSSCRCSVATLICKDWNKAEREQDPRWSTYKIDLPKPLKHLLFFKRLVQGGHLQSLEIKLPDPYKASVIDDYFGHYISLAGGSGIQVWCHKLHSILFTPLHLSWCSWNTEASEFWGTSNSGKIKLEIIDPKSSEDIIPGNW